MIHFVALIKDEHIEETAPEPWDVWPTDEDRSGRTLRWRSGCPGWLPCSQSLRSSVAFREWTCESIKWTNQMNQSNEPIKWTNQMNQSNEPIKWTNQMNQSNEPIKWTNQMNQSNEPIKWTNQMNQSNEPIKWTNQMNQSNEPIKWTNQINQSNEPIKWTNQVIATKFETYVVSKNLKRLFRVYLKGFTVQLVGVACCSSVFLFTVCFE